MVDLSRRLQRVVAGGRRTLTIPGAAARLSLEVKALRRAHLRTGADLLDSLTEAAQFGERDVFGRLVSDHINELTDRWLAAAVYVREVRAVLRSRE